VAAEEGGGGGKRRGLRHPAAAWEGVAVAEWRWGAGAHTFYTRVVGFGGDSYFLGHSSTIPAQFCSINQN
jgi:hypothetical protein